LIDDRKEDESEEKKSEKYQPENAIDFGKITQGEISNNLFWRLLNCEKENELSAIARFV